MAGLVPAIHVLHDQTMYGGYVYILASAPNGILYVGVTNDLVRRVYEHRNVSLQDSQGSIRSSAWFILSVMMTFEPRFSVSAI